VEDVRDGRDAEVERGVRLLRRRIRVACRDDRPALEREPDERLRPRELRRERDLRHRRCVEEPLEQREVGIASMLARVRAEALGREKRPLEMGAEDPGGRAVRRHRTQRVEERRLGRGDERRLIRGDARGEERLPRARIIRCGRREEVHARVAVHLEVDEPGHRDAAACGRRQPDVDDDAVLDLDVPGHELPAHERGLDLEPHDAPPSAIRTEPFAPSRRRRADSASTPARSATSATRASPSAAPSATATFRRARSRSFAFHRAAPTISPAYVRPRRTFTIVEIAFSTSFCAVPAFRRVEPETISAPTGVAISIDASCASGLPGTQTTATQSAPLSPAVRRAASVYGVVPLALIATTASSGPTRSACSCATPRSSSSSASSWSATTATTSPGGDPKVGPTSAASSAAIPPEVPAPT